MAVEARRGCGYRRVGGLYLEGMGDWSPCCRLPTEIALCPTCGGGIHFSRNIQFMLPKALFAEPPVCLTQMPIDQTMRADCPLATIENSTAKIALVWIGAGDYPTPKDFMTEANEQGISRRIATLPKDLTLGVTRVMLAHRKAIKCDTCLGAGIVADIRAGEGVGSVGDTDEAQCHDCDGKGYRPGVFASFVPSKITRVVTHAMARIAEAWLALEQKYEAAVRLAYERGHFVMEWMESPEAGLDLPGTPCPMKPGQARAKIVLDLATRFVLLEPEIEGYEWVKNDLKRDVTLFEVPDDDPDHAPRTTKRRALPKMPTKAEAEAADIERAKRAQTALPAQQEE